VLCLHGLAGTPWDVRPAAEHLAGLGFRCVGPLLPGHGTRPEDLARTPARAWLDAAFAAHAELAARHSRVYVLGLSMGGVLGLGLCRYRPVRGAVLLAVPLRIRPRLRIPVQLLHRFVASAPRIPGIADPLARQVNPGYRRMPLAAVHALIGLLAQVRAELPGVRQPLLLVYSTGDRTVEFGNADWLRAEVGSERVELLRLERSGHILGVDLERDRIAAHSARFLLELEACGD
jgi:carboxylesterase